MTMLRAVIPYKQLSKIVLADGTEIETHGHIMRVEYYPGNIYAEITILMKMSELKEIHKSKEEIEQEMKGG